MTMIIVLLDIKSFFSHGFLSRCSWLYFFCLGVSLVILPPSQSYAKAPDQEEWFLHHDFQTLSPESIAVLPMDNFSLDPEMEGVLQHEVHQRLHAKGYRRISAQAVARQMEAFGVQTPGQLAGLSRQRLCEALNTDALLSGRVDQSGTIHAGVYDAVVVSCSLELTHCETGELLWQGEQWRATHRQWQLDPINALVNLGVHRSSSREQRLAWLVQEMLKTLSDGPVRVETDNLLLQAVEIEVQE